MIKVCELVTRRPGLSVEEFQAYWRDVHAPIVAAIGGIRRYVQCHPLLSGYRSGQLVFDGVAEIWVDDKAALAAMAQTAEFAAAKADEANFIDTGALIELVVDEHVIKNGAIPANGVKSVGFVRFREGLAPEVARPYWRDVHGPIAADISVLRRYEQNQVRAGAYRRATRPAWDGMALTWFDSIDDMRRSATEPAYAATLADGPEFLASGPTPTILCRELVVL